MLLKCLKCGSPLQVGAESCACPKCGAGWPVVRGIPRFFDLGDYYWGEVGQNEARELLDAARAGSWREAVRSRFAEGDNMHFGLLDLQRASWAPMLGLDATSVALDISSGYGAITHSLSRSVGELYSTEAIPERIEFTQERLRQEGISNVRLVQASATALPLVENSFDLVVTNGVLEWVGEWEKNGDPRDAQLRFLAVIRRLLKADGVLVIGIENRIGYGLFLGGKDHSGISYTSLVPRRVASLMLRHSATPHHRTVLNEKKQYRTYTYSERGCRRLLADAGFAEVSCHWADPGYNQPYHLIPLDTRAWVEEQFTDVLDHPGPAPRVSWRRQAKRTFARSKWLGRVLPDFLLVAAKEPRRTTELERWIERQLAGAEGDGGSARSGRRMTWALYTHPFAQKSVVRLGDLATARDVAYAKLEVGSEAEGDSLEAELAHMKAVRERLAGIGSVAVPQALGALRVGSTLYCLEEAAHGEKFSRVVRHPGYFADSRRVRSDFERVTKGILELSEALQGLALIPDIDPSWRAIPAELESRPDLAKELNARRYFSISDGAARPAWIQHGDLSVENVFLDRNAGRIEIIDWANLSGGMPPLYDLFTLLYSTGYLSPAEERLRYASEEDRWIASFNAVFFEDSEFSRMAHDLVVKACERLRVAPELVPALVVEYLLIRAHYYRTRSPVQHRVFLRLLERCLAPDAPKVFGGVR